MHTRHVGNGIGSAAGFAWPTFGLLTGALSLTAIKITSLILLASVCSSAFLLLCPFVVWHSYKQNEKEKALLEENLEEAKNELRDKILDYLQELANIYIMENSVLDDRFDVFIEKEISNRPSLPYQHIKEILPQFKNSLTTHKNFSIKQKFFADIEPPILVKEHYSDMDFLTRFKTGVMGFVSGFGSIAGCSAGILGLLTTLTVISATPILYVVPLIAGILFGLTTCVSAILSAKKRHQKTQIIADYDKTTLAVNKELQAQQHQAYEKIQALKLKKNIHLIIPSPSNRERESSDYELSPSPLPIPMDRILFPPPKEHQRKIIKNENDLITPKSRVSIS